MAARQDEPGSNLPAPPLASPEEEIFWGKVSAQVARRRRVRHARNQRIAATALFLLFALPGALHFAQRDKFVLLSDRGQSQEFIGIGSVGTKGRGGGTGSYGSDMGDLGGKYEGAVEVLIEHDQATVRGPLDPELIGQVIQRHQTQLRFCYERLLIRYPALSGEKFLHPLSLHFQILGDGTVGAITVDPATVARIVEYNLELEGCVTQRVRTWLFPEPQGGGTVEVTYPILFQVTAPILFQVTGE